MTGARPPQSSSSRWLAVTSALVLAGACSKREPDKATPAVSVSTAPARSASVGDEPSARASSSAKPDLGRPCTTSFDCPAAPGCDVACVDVCQLRVRSGTVGAPDCIGDVLLGETSTRRSAVARATLCDLAKGVYCEKATGRCAAAKKVGDACSSEDEECGADGSCSAGKCRPASAVGGPCNPGKCSSAGFCNFEKSRCEARRPNGAHCDLSNQCTSGNCTAAGCAAAEAQTCAL